MDFGSARVKATPPSIDGTHIRQILGEDRRMAISLNKGGRLSLSKEAPDLKKALIGLGWDPRATDGAASI
jgi:hypothetical protein